tara:strand:+ start:16448 stop:17647 length:1200 start_codon:yes stop_codon:yes gene_type:complete
MNLKFRNCLCKKKIIYNSKNYISFKKLPMTEIFTNKFKKLKSFSLDQGVVFCKSCEHMRLTKFVDSKKIYNKNYLTSSSNSFSAKHANDEFYNFILKNLKQNKKYSKILEIGSNDLYLLKKFSKKAKNLIGIDPVIKRDKKLNNLKTYKDFFIKIDNNKIGLDIDSIICGHTLEHVENPELFIKKTLSLSNNKTKIFFQFPSAESLINNCSFDQIHNQHLNYFSIKSFSKILEKCGGRIIDYDYNELHYGALMVFFTIKSSKIKTKKIIKLKKKIINYNLVQSYQNFKVHLKTYKNLINQYLSSNKKFYVIGAGLMLPIIDYHLDGLIGKADAILDDDPNKINKYFANINTKIINLKNTDLRKSICLIAPVASAIITRKLISVLEQKKAEIILTPTLTF